MHASTFVLLLRVRQDYADDGYLRSLGGEGEIRIGRPVAVTLDQQVERVPLAQLLEHREIQANLRPIAKVLEELNDRRAIAERPANKDNTIVVAGCCAAPIDAAFVRERPDDSDVTDVTGLVKPVAHDVPNHQVACGR